MAKQLGYACINMTLAKQGISCNRSMIRRTFDAKGVAYASELILENLRNLTKIVSWNNQHGIKVYRMSSNMFPWMSEYEFTDLPDYDKICNLLKGIGTLAMENGQRLSFHPGQFCVLASPNEEVVLNAMNELDKSAQIMDLMGLPESRMAKINIHVGGAYGDKKSALERFCKNFLRLQPSAQARLTVENDDKPSLYTTEELYNDIYKRIDIPVVFDYHHHDLHPGRLTEREALDMALATWPVGIRPVVHYSESRSDEYGDPRIKPQAHSDSYVRAINTYGYEMDIMLEAKHKELALLEYRDIMKKELKVVA